MDAKGALLLGDAAFQAHVPRLAPGGSPGVLHQPVWLALLILHVSGSFTWCSGIEGHLVTSGLMAQLKGRCLSGVCTSRGPKAGKALSLWHFGRRYVPLISCAVVDWGHPALS